MKQAKFLVSHFDAGVEKFKAGQIYPLEDETRLCIARGAAEEVDVAEEPKTVVKADPDQATSDSSSSTESKQGDDDAAAGKSSGKGKK